MPFFNHVQGDSWSFSFFFRKTHLSLSLFLKKGEIRVWKRKGRALQDLRISLQLNIEKLPLHPIFSPFSLFSLFSIMIYVASYYLIFMNLVMIV